MDKLENAQNENAQTEKLHFEPCIVLIQAAASKKPL